MDDTTESYGTYYMVNNHKDLSVFKILMDECIEVPKESLPVAQINLEKMFTYMQIQKSSSDSIFYLLFLRSSQSKVLSQNFRFGV